MLQASFLTAMAVLPVFLVGAFSLELRRDLGIGSLEVGIVGTVFFASSALTATLAGVLTERLGAGTTLRVSAAMTSGVLALIAAGPPWPWLLVAAVIGGSAQSFVQPGTNLALTTVVDARRLALAMALKQAAIPAATLFSGVAVAMAGEVSWRWAFVLASVIALGNVAEPLQAGAAPTRVPRVSRGTRDRVGVRRQPGAGPRRLLAAGAGMGAAAATALAIFLTDLLVGAGASLREAGLVMAVSSVLGIAARLGLGVAADRRPRGRHLLVIGSMLLLASPCYVGLVLIDLPLMALLAAGCYVLGFSWNGLLMFATVRAWPVQPARATATIQVGLGAGAACGPLVFGFVVQVAPDPGAWLTMALLSLVGGLAIVAADRWTAAQVVGPAEAA